jgi:hypothetical protein
MRSGPTPGTANSTDPSGPDALTILKRFRLMLRSPGPPGRLISTTRSRVGIGTTSLRCRQYRRHLIPVESIVKVPCVNDRGRPAASPLRKQLTSRDCPPAKAVRPLWRCESPFAKGSLTVSPGWRSTSKKVRDPPARRALLTHSGCHASPFGVLDPSVRGYVGTTQKRGSARSGLCLQAVAVELAGQRGTARGRPRFCPRTPQILEWRCTPAAESRS